MSGALSLSPISNEDASALPVKELGPAIAYCESVMGFTVTGRDATTAALKRDGAQMGLIIKRDHQPHEAGSLAFAVDDIDGLHREWVSPSTLTTSILGRVAELGSFGQVIPSACQKSLVE